MFQVSGNSLQGHFGFANDRCQRTPLLAKRVLFHSSGDFHSLSVDLGLQDLGFVGLTGVLQPTLGFDDLFRDTSQVRTRIRHLLCSQDSIERHFDGSFDAHLLFFSFDFGQLCVFVHQLTHTREFSGGDNGLFDEKALLAAVNLTASNFVP